jgi:hypothetical protein
VQKNRTNTSAITIDRNLLARTDSSSATSENGSSCSWKIKHPFIGVSNIAHEKICNGSEAVSRNTEKQVFDNQGPKNTTSHTLEIYQVSQEQSSYLIQSIEYLTTL